MSPFFSGPGRPQSFYPQGFADGGGAKGMGLVDLFMKGGMGGGPFDMGLIGMLANMGKEKPAPVAPSPQMSMQAVPRQLEEAKPRLAPAVGLVAAAGRGNDTELAHFTKDELELLDAFKGGERDLNPDTGLPQYGWLGNLLKGLVRAGATIAGGMIAGPVGAAAGSGLSTKLTGGSWKEALSSAAMSGIGSYGAQGISGGGWSPTTKFGSVPVSGGVDLANNTANFNFGNPSFLSAAKSAPGLSAMMGSLSTPLEKSNTIPLSTTPDGPSFSVRPMERTQRPFQGDISRYGEGPGHKFYDRINPPPEFVPRGENIVEYDLPEAYAHGGSVHGYAEGGPMGLAGPTKDAIQQAVMQGYMMARKGGAAHEGRVAGPGGGTDDLIPAKLSAGEHVWTAREVSALGAGDNEEGQRKMYALRQEVLKKGGFKNTSPRKQTPKIKGIGNLKLTAKI